LSEENRLRGIEVALDAIGAILVFIFLFGVGVCSK